MERPIIEDYTTGNPAEAFDELLEYTSKLEEYCDYLETIGEEILNN